MNLWTKPRQEVQCITINTITNQAGVKREIIVKGKNTYGRDRKLKPRSCINGAVAKRNITEDNDKTTQRKFKKGHLASFSQWYCFVVVVERLFWLSTTWKY